MTEPKALESVRAEIEIVYEGSLDSLAQKLRQDLQLPEFWIKSDPNPPHTKVAMTECLGFELWLSACDNNDKGNFHLKFETMSTNLGKSKTVEVGDLSDWFANHISVVCELSSTVIG